LHAGEAAGSPRLKCAEQRDSLSAFRQQRVGEMRTDQAGAAGDEVGLAGDLRHDVTRSSRRRSPRTTAQAFTCWPTNSTIRSNMSPLLERSGDWPAWRSISIYSSAIEPPALR